MSPKTVLSCVAGFTAAASVIVLGNSWEKPVGRFVADGVEWTAKQVMPQKMAAKSKFKEQVIVFSDQEADAIDQEFQRIRKYVTEHAGDINKAMAFLRSNDQDFRLKTYIMSDDLIYGLGGLKTATSAVDKKATIKQMQRGVENYNWQLTRAVESARANGISLSNGPTKTYICVMRKLDAHISGQAGPNPDFRVSMEARDMAPLPPG